MISSFKELLAPYATPSPLDSTLAQSDFCPLDLSASNEALRKYDVTDVEACQRYIDLVLTEQKAKVAYGGYLEKRNLYADKRGFNAKKSPRNIHLGVDFWTMPGTKVIAPLHGKVHSYRNNTAMGDYGPTIILKHDFQGVVFHSLYGHLSVESLENLSIGQEFRQGEPLATLGTSDINVNYAPHLHFQFIIDMEGMQGDYPGVCSEDRVSYYAQNCPNPNILFNL